MTAHKYLVTYALDNTTRRRTVYADGFDVQGDCMVFYVVHWWLWRECVAAFAIGSVRAVVVAQ